jgi:LacI family transcriptional regulator
LLAQCPDLDAIFACNDQMALGALGAVHQRGIKVPQDIAFAGFDNIPDSACFWPPLTTVEQHLVAAGAISVQVLQKLIEARQMGQSEHFVEMRLLVANRITMA